MDSVKARSTVDKLEMAQGGLKLAFAAVSAINTVRLLMRLVREKNIVSLKGAIAVGQAVAAVFAAKQAISDFRASAIPGDQTFDKG
ncbi:hypothetical protein N8J89_32015 [Crossiella sp. CA-258035]|uniref:hypothetical protein n=1 Tax=Crossiella sp. CA-258035 TaxID=2981138 RepID=UPI0024BCC647|nr:hypothetical protein [Crossiella sp. CA-258035]WHT17713.1 hypothetical protein N8J89_32015 [Crossiella sp. CA-258035]